MSRDEIRHSMNRDYDSDGDFVIRPSRQNDYEDEDVAEEENEYSYPEEVDDDVESYEGNMYHFGDEENERDEAYENSQDSEHSGENPTEEVDGNEGDDIEDELRNTTLRGAQRQSSLQELLGSLAQNMEGPSREHGGENSRRVNIADIFPEMFSMMGAGRSTGRGNPRLIKLLDNVTNAQDDPYIAMESLRELSEQLLMMSPLAAERAVPQEDLLKGIVDIFMDPLLQGELELQLIAFRCLYNLFEVNPDMISIAVDRNVIAACNDKLAEISYIDLAEQVLETLEIISRLHGRSVLQSGSLLACLQYLDFFTSHAQRKAVTIVVNSCAKIRAVDLGHISDIMWRLKEIFVSSQDHSLRQNMLNVFYGICAGLGRGDKTLEGLFDFELIESIMQLISNGETNLESRLKAFDILSQVLVSGEVLAPQIIGCGRVLDMLMSSMNEYKKSTASQLHETVMFAPKPLLTCISRFIVVLFPGEDKQILSADTPKQYEFQGIEEQSRQLVKGLGPFLVQVYVNAVDFQIRRLVLVALARVLSPHIPIETCDIDKGIVSMIASSLARNMALFEQSGFKDQVSGVLLLGSLRLVTSLLEKNASEHLPAFVREGVFESFKSFSKELSSIVPESLEKTQAGDPPQNNGKFTDISDTNSESNYHSDDDDYNMEFEGMESPDHTRPNRVCFRILKHLKLNYVQNELANTLESVIESYGGEGAVISEISEINSLVERLRLLDVHSDTYEYWQRIWLEVKSKLFMSNFVCSGFEFISSGLADEMSKLVLSNSSKSSICQRALIETFGEDLETFAEIIQSALTRLESFELLDCGLHGEDGKGASLGKQVKIRLEYDGDAVEDGIPKNLQAVTVAIHCVATFRSLNEFLKHRVLQSQLITSLIPALAMRVDRQDDDVKWSFDFAFNNTKCDHQDTIFGAIFRPIKNAGKDSKSLWSEPHIIRYKKAQGKDSDQKLSTLYFGGPRGLNELGRLEGLLVLLKCLRGSSLRPECFVNSKISAKLACQLEEPLIVAGGLLPSWTVLLTRNYPFLFPFETRMFFLQSSSFGHGRLIQVWRNRVGSDKGDFADALHQLGRPTRRKLKVSRGAVFLSALKILDKYGSTPNILEVEFLNEVGTGLGPTLEFFAIVSKEFAYKSLRMWRSENFNSCKEGELVEEHLFPAPLLASSNQEKTLELFHKLGTFVSRSMLDDRILDFRFSKAFFELAHMYARNEKIRFDDFDLTIDYMSMVDPHLAKSMKYLFTLKNDHDFESLSLTFYLSGYNIELIENGKDVAVTIENFPDYFERLSDQVLGTGVKMQIQSFIEGFSRTFPYTSLLALTPDELTDLFGSVEEDWTHETLYAYVDADHGYSHDSNIIHDLISIMTSFSKAERRLFLEFLTGSPKLPIGGFKSLNPRMTVVRKHTENDLEPDHYLPSVMTCANYLKLPKYSNKDVLKSRVLQAMKEGLGAFLLS
ncbi:putative ubiquitin-protein ligase UFD4 [Lachancea thermotolerans CBS 6340]|uniref:HECT-type E3 ubiquitin transferase n=1 Tax=Lachancea thermotolerans (strain ATCC 56472 / CBS 6340 / NRRL Y-8284) TaxID=559295 RepID=C5DGK3_LACTC|nr:KLTH0D06028p [Lachancea thermotolerans CBS 6340]CAR22545.1 KLTH0D06028p [Lachancea thermotolerans CBS 6340]